MPLAPIVWVAIPSNRIATAATTKQNEIKPQCAGTRTRPSARTYGFFDVTVDVDVVFVCPGAIALFPCVTVEDVLVFVCPGAVPLFPCEPAEPPGAC